MILASPCFGQAKVDLKQEKPNINRILRGGTLAGNDAQAFKLYFSEFFKQFVDPKAGPDTLPQLRKDLVIFLRGGKQGAAYDALIADTLKYMQFIAKSPKFSAAAKVNAVLVLGSLNDKEVTGEGKPLPTPYPWLVGMVIAPSASYPDAMKIAAMNGLRRYAESGILPANKKDELSTLMMGILTQESPPGGRTLEGHNWMRLSAAQVLAALGSPGKDNNVVKAFEKVIADSGQRASFRCEMAECLGKLQITKESNVDYQTLTNLLGHQAVEICKGEIEAAKSSGRPVSRGMIVYALASTMHGLKGQSGRAGLAAAAPDASAQTTIDTLYKAIEATYTKAQDEDEVADTELATTVDALVTELQGSLQPKPQPKQDVVAAADGAAPPPAPPAAAN